MPAFDSAKFRQVLGHFTTGVTVITGATADGPVGLAVGSFASVSLDPPLVAFFADKTSSSWPKIAPSGAFCVNILGQHQEDVCRRFASKEPDKFAGLGWSPASSGSPLIDGVIAWIDCDIQEVTEAGDHVCVLGAVRELDVGHDGPPLLFFRGGYGRFEV
jgi:flavin reductase (DIM6/NTAB) family NADH-FMN oxidoreductase RutF